MPTKHEHNKIFKDSDKLNKHTKTKIRGEAEADY